MSVYGEQIANVKFNDLIEKDVIVRPFIHLLVKVMATHEMDEVVSTSRPSKEVVEHYETEHSDTPVTRSSSVFKVLKPSQISVTG